MVILPATRTRLQRAGTEDQTRHPAHFEYRMMGADRQFRSHFRYGRIALVIGFSFLAITLWHDR